MAFEPPIPDPAYQVTDSRDSIMLFTLPAPSDTTVEIVWDNRGAPSGGHVEASPRQIAIAPLMEKIYSMPFEAPSIASAFLGASDGTNLREHYARLYEILQTTTIDPRDFDIYANGGALTGEIVTITSDSREQRHRLMRIAVEHGAILAADLTPSTTLHIDASLPDFRDLSSAHYSPNHQKLVSGNEFLAWFGLPAEIQQEPVLLPFRSVSHNGPLRTSSTTQNNLGRNPSGTVSPDGHADSQPDNHGARADATAPQGSETVSDAGKAGQGRAAAFQLLTLFAAATVPFVYDFLTVHTFLLRGVAAAIILLLDIALLRLWLQAESSFGSAIASNPNERRNPTFVKKAFDYIVLAASAFAGFTLFLVCISEFSSSHFGSFSVGAVLMLIFNGIALKAFHHLRRMKHF